MNASISPGTTPAMNKVPTDVFVATEYITITMEGGIRMPSAPDVVMTPAPKRFGNPAFTIAGRMIEPMATTVAGLDPDTAANKAHAMTPARPRPPCQWPTTLVAKLIMRRATPPCVRKLPARMKNGIAMISNFSIPVNSFSATDSTGTWVMVKRKVSTVKPSAIEIGMPVRIRATSKRKIIREFMSSLLAVVDPPGLRHGPGHAWATLLFSGRPRPLAGSGKTSGSSPAEWPGRQSRSVFPDQPRSDRYGQYP